MPLFLLHVDEAESMQTRLQRDVKRHTNYSAFTRVIDSFKVVAALAVFTATATRLYELAPPQTMHSSDRVVAHDTIPLPFWELPFDVNVGESGISMGSLTLEEITSTPHIVKFGCPL